jgi:hypothetical protein
MIGPKLIALLSDEGAVTGLALFNANGAYYRDDREWLQADPDDDDDRIDGRVAVDATLAFVDVFDTAEDSGGTLTAHDVV